MDLLERCELHMLRLQESLELLRRGRVLERIGAAEEIMRKVRTNPELLEGEIKAYFDKYPTRDLVVRRQVCQG